MTKSIISNEPYCFICGTSFNLHRHHIFYGRGRRQISERYGCWVYLCSQHHNASNMGVHFNKEFDKNLKKYCQREWEKLNGSREDFIRTFGKSYVEVENEPI